MNRALLGFLIAPLVPCAIIFLLAIFYGGAGVEFWIILILPISYLTSLFIGGPLYIIFNKYNCTNVIHYLIAGVLSTAVPIFFIFFYPSLINQPHDSIFHGILPVHFGIMGLMIAFGVSISTVFWFIARPDKA